MAEIATPVPARRRRPAGRLAYRLMYAVGITPWDDDEPPPELVDLVQGRTDLPPGRALDLGCGTGTDSVFLARHGWQVTGVDFLANPLRAARRRADAAGVAVTWVQGSVAALSASQVTGPFDLVHDVGCFHGLTDDERDRYAAAVTTLSAPGATMLLFAFQPRKGPGPRGVDRLELDQYFSHWQLVESHPDTHADLQGPMRNAQPQWHSYRRL